jgi:branched-chain amino acid transport system substrate-binding protein
MPVIGQEGGEMHFMDSPIFFDHSSAGKPLVDWTIVAGARGALPLGKKVLGTLSCQEVVFCSVADTSWKELGGKLGFKTVYAGKASLLNVDFTSQCLAAKNAGVDVLGLVFDTAGIERIAQSCSAVNFHPLYFYTSVQSNVSFLNNPHLANSIIAQPLRPWFLTDHPEIRQFQSVMKQYAPGLAIDSSSLNGWAAATLFERAAPAFAADTVTPDGILKAMWQVKNDDMDGLSYPVTFSQTKPHDYKVCGWVVWVRPGKFESDGKMTCL